MCTGEPGCIDGIPSVKGQGAKGEKKKLEERERPDGRVGGVLEIEVR
jgi:hypothetical protein